jgi:hypothetical protein
VLGASNSNNSAINSSNVVGDTQYDISLLLYNHYVKGRSYRSFKAYALPGARKRATSVTANIRYLQRLVLEFASKHLFVTAAGVREYAKSTYGLELSPRRVHDSIVRLVKRGLLEKVAYGIYRLTQAGKNALAALFNSSNKKTSKEVGSMAGAPIGVGCVFGRYRLHVRGARSLEDLARQLYALYKVVGCALYGVRQLLSRRRFRRVVGGVSVSCVEFRVGGHGCSLVGRGRSLKRPLIDLDYFYSLGIPPKEIGVDVLAAVRGVKPSVKVYFD